MSRGASPPAGVLPLDKPEGPTSHDIVAAARKILDTPHVGHAGTLDPMATGLLVLCVGRATRLAQFLTARDKVYVGRLRLGWETDTLDRTGTQTTDRCAVGATEPEIRAAMRALEGSSRQVPPAFSAKRVGGTRAHELARSGAPPTLEAVDVRVDEFRAAEIGDDEVAFEVQCSAGTYVRSLVRDLGRTLGCGAHLTALRRTQSGTLRLEAATTLERLRDEARRGSPWSDLIPAGEVDLGMPMVRVDSEAALRLAHGRALELGDWDGPAPPHEALCRVIDARGALVAVARSVAGPGDAGRLCPHRVFIQPSECH